ncbi:MAG: invasin domain 3-containing protein [Candidatus Arsenophonus phytopathogenicus]
MTAVTKVTLIADSTKPGVDKSKLEAAPNRIVANGTESSVIKLTLKDINGNAIVGHKDQVKFTTSLTK